MQNKLVYFAGLTHEKNIPVQLRANQVGIVHSHIRETKHCIYRKAPRRKRGISLCIPIP